ncbi:MAG: cobalamin biosynthesis protein CbiX [Frankiales bacterium]|nr:cobalamin biosynthesis protein CbiX [Frankiales bacterium]
MTVLLGVAHGSRDERAQQVIQWLLAGAAALRPGLEAAAAYVDNASPSIRSALDDLARRGVEDVVVVPLLLTSASHAKTDIAASVQAARFDHPRMRLRYGRPLGPHPVLVEVLARRLAEAGAGAEEPVVLVAGGSLDPDANAQVSATARLLWEGRSFPTVDVAFASTTGPSVAEALDRVRRLGFSRAGVACYFLGPGRLPAAVAAAASAHDLEVVVAEPLGAAAEIAALVLERYDEALGSDIRMSCDACLYRIPFPGREGSVGAPQVPHSHPDDV